MLIDHSKLPWMKNWEERHQQRLRESVRKSLMLRTPTTDDELWMVCGYRWGLWFARTPLTPENDPPFRFLADAYFERWDRMFGLAAKGTGKTQQFAVLHQLNSENKPGTWTAHVGAIEKQAMRCNDYVQQALEKENLIGKEVELLLDPIAVRGESMRSLRKWRNGSRLEILAGTLGQVSGPHPQVGAMDEFELGTWEVWEHFSKNLKASPIKRAQMVLGSTRFRAKGPVDRLLGQKKGVFKVIRWSIYDAMAKCNMDCFKDPEWGTCPLYSRQEVQLDGSTQEVPMCHGRAHHGVGHMSRDEVLTAYLMGDMLSWGTLMELHKPTTEGLFFPELQVPDEGDERPTRHVNPDYEYVPGRPVYLGYDDGFAWPLSLGAWQMRDDGFLYQFDEIYLRRAIPQMVIEVLDKKPWIEDVEMGWPDPTARSAIAQYRDWFQARLGRPVMVWNTDNDRINGWKALRRRIWTPPGVAMLGYHPRCRNTYRDVAGLAKLEGTEDCQKLDDHGADQTRYLVYNLDRYLGVQGRMDRDDARPEGGVEMARKAMASRVETQIRERWDRLVRLGVKAERLKAVEEGMGPARREDFRKALGSWLAELTTTGRLQRAGLTAADPDDPDRPA